MVRWVLILTLIVAVGGLVGTGCLGSPFGEGLGCSSVEDAGEPNDQLAQATTLVPGKAYAAAISSADSPGDTDVYACSAPGEEVGTHFRVELKSSRVRHLKMQVGASLPDAWEAVSWPGWKPRQEADRLVVEGDLGKGTLIVVVSGDRRAEYSLLVTWTR